MTSARDLVFVPLGGAGEIGMNMYLYGYGSAKDRRWIMVDCGVTFGDMETTPGVDLIMPDPDFIAAQVDRLDAIFITHGHEDHVGALGRLWPELKVPVYARDFTARLARLKLEEAGLGGEVVRTVSAWPEFTAAGPFRVSFVPVSHSIPESSALVIEVGGHRVLHTGDFKIDHDPQVGEAFDETVFWQLGKLGVDALVCDSTNVFSPNPGRSEAELITPLTALIKGAPGLVVATTFASNLARLQTLALAAQAAGRSVTVYGRAMNRMVSTAREAGLIPGFPEVVGEDRAGDVPAEHLLVLASGSQGERRAAIAQIAGGTSPRVAVQEGDLVLFSSKVIPGNEKAVGRILNRFSLLGARVVDDAGGLYHVSGHANRPDLKSLHALIQPKLLVPMHGEHRHLVEHVALGQESGIAGLVVPNGKVARIAGGAAEVIGEVETGRVYLDGMMLIGALDGVVRERIKLALRGLIVASVVVDQEGDLAADPVVQVLGVVSDIDENVHDLGLVLEEAIDKAFEKANSKQVRKVDAIETLVSTTCTNLCNRLTGRKPVIVVNVSRVEVE